MATPPTTIAPDVQAEIARWLSYLGTERRMSGKTVEAYARDVAQFLGFLAAHRGAPPSLRQLAKLTPADIRAFMAARRRQGIGNRSLMRGLAGARSFARFLERNGKGKVAALAAVRTPKVPRTLPKPLSASAARSMTETGLRAGGGEAPWSLGGDAAVLGWLYGAGRRVSEAVGLTRGSRIESTTGRTNSPASPIRNTALKPIVVAANKSEKRAALSGFSKAPHRKARKK